MSENRVYNVLIVGVGGQGIILASDVLSLAAARHGYPPLCAALAAAAAGGLGARRRPVSPAVTTRAGLG